ncbi:MAG: CDGSH iron-sulfur domain-containing protein [Thermodesulfobacteriota bacterium]
MSEKTTIQILKDGPLIVSGTFEVVGPSDKKIDCESKVALCRCGDSANKPFCDGTHKKSGFCDGSGG